MLVLALALVHEGLELGIVVLGDSLGGHLDGAGTAGCGDALGDLLDGLFEDSDTDGLVESLRGENVEGRRNELDLDHGVFGVAGLSLAQGVLDGVDSFVAEAGNLDIGTDLCGLGRQTLADVGNQLLLDDVVGELDLVPDLLAVLCKSTGHV